MFRSKTPNPDDDAKAPRMDKAAIGRKMTNRKGRKAARAGRKANRKGRK